MRDVRDKVPNRSMSASGSGVGGGDVERSPDERRQTAIGETEGCGTTGIRAGSGGGSIGDES